jgi:putative ABC transport system ATP-binding protein
MKGITKSYYMGTNELQVLKGIDLTINRGEYVAILGPSGSGKSTLMNIIGCIDLKTEGQYVLSKQDIEALGEDELAEIRNKEIGFVFQKFNLIGRYDATYNVQMPLLLKGETYDESRKHAMNYLEKVGLGDRMGHKPIELSGGQQQRVAIARSLVCEPNIILGDEPTGNLDTVSGEEVMKIFRDLHNEGRTVILITHDQEVADEADRIIHIRDGLIEKDEITQRSKAI